MPSRLAIPIAAWPPRPVKFRGRIERLRQATVDATDFSVPWAQFHDELAVAPGFAMSGVRADNPRLRLVIERALQRLQPDLRLGEALLLHSATSGTEC